MQKKASDPLFCSIFAYVVSFYLRSKNALFCCIIHTSILQNLQEVMPHKPQIFFRSKTILQKLYVYILTIKNY